MRWRFHSTTGCLRLMRSLHILDNSPQLALLHMAEAGGTSGCSSRSANQPCSLICSRSFSRSRRKRQAGGERCIGSKMGRWARTPARPMGDTARIYWRCCTLRSSVCCVGRGFGRSQHDHATIASARTSRSRCPTSPLRRTPKPYRLPSRRSPFSGAGVFLTGSWRAPGA